MSNRFNLVKYFLFKDIKAKYAGSGLGVFWNLVLPLFQILLYWFVFSTVMRVRSYSSAHIPYVYFLLSTFFFWLAIPEGILRSGMIIIDNGELIKKVSFPNVTLPIAVTLSGYVQSLIGVLLFVLIFMMAGLAHMTMVFVIPVFLLQVIFSVGVGILMAAIVTYVRDLQQIMNYVLQGMFFLSPIIYSLDAIPERFRKLAYLNPVTVYMESYHQIILDRTFPGLREILGMVFISFFFLFLGIFVFNKLNEGFADIL